MWRHLPAGLLQDGDFSDCGAIYQQLCSGMGIVAIMAPSTSRFAAGWDFSNCCAIYRQFCSGMGIAVIVAPSIGRFAAGLDWSNCGTM